MATEGFSFSTNKKKNDSYFKDSSNDKYRNFNLNRGHKYSENCFGETKTSKFGLKNDSYKFSGAFNSFKEEKNKSLFDYDKSWKTSFQLKQDPLGSHYSNISKIKDNKKSKNAFDSRDHGFSLSDHIQKNMHLYESPAADDEILTFKKDKKKFKNAIDRCLSSSSDLKDSWEFPRQQEDVVPQEPEVMNFTASQKLLHPSQNEESTNDQLSPSVDDDDDDDVDAATKIFLAEEQRKIAEDNSLIGKKFKGDQKKSFTITSKIAKGGFGAVYRCVEDDENRKEYAIKCSADEDFNMEIEVLKKANDAKTKHIYRLIDSGFDKDHDRIFIVINLLGPSLWEKFKDKNGDEWDPMKWKLAEQCLIGLQNLHELGYLHLDIKQNNFAMGLGENEFMVYLIDFGLSIKNGSSRKQSEEVNECYSSIAAMEEKKLGPKDDIESLLYMIKTFFGGRLPWNELDDDEKTKILEMKKDLRNDESDVFKQFFGEPQSIFEKDSGKETSVYMKNKILNKDKTTFPELLKIMRYSDSLKAEDGPNYDKIFYFLHSAYEKAHQKAAIKFEMEMAKLKNDVEKEELQKKFRENSHELQQLSKHCKTNVKKPENMAFLIGYKMGKKTESNPSGKSYNAVEYNGQKFNLINGIKPVTCYRNSTSGKSIYIFYPKEPKLGDEVKISPNYESE